MDRSVMLAGLIAALTSALFFVLVSVYYYLRQRIGFVRRLDDWVWMCIVCWLFGLWIFALGYLVL